MCAPEPQSKSRWLSWILRKTSSVRVARQNSCRRGHRGPLDNLYV